MLSPCVVRHGADAVSDAGACVTCGGDPVALLRESGASSAAKTAAGAARALERWAAGEEGEA